MATAKKKSVSREDWDFCKESVHDEELGACLLYEYAREKLRRSPALQKIFIKSITPEFTFSSHFQLAPYFSGDYGSAVLNEDLLDTPWLLSAYAGVPIVEKKEFGIKKGNKTTPALFRGEEFYQEMDFPSGVTALDHFKWITPVAMRQVKKRNPVIQNLRYGFFCIDLNMADKPIVDQFASWLESQRPKRREGAKRNAENDGTGMSFTLIKQRTLLKQLGASRLLFSGMTVEEAQNFSQKHSKNKSPIYGDIREWSRAKIAVEDGIIKLFPERVR